MFLDFLAMTVYCHAEHFIRQKQILRRTTGFRNITMCRWWFRLTSGSIWTIQSFATMTRAEQLELLAVGRRHESSCEMEMFIVFQWKNLRDSNTWGICPGNHWKHQKLSFGRPEYLSQIVWLANMFRFVAVGQSDGWAYIARLDNLFIILPL